MKQRSVKGFFIVGAVCAVFLVACAVKKNNKVVEPAKKEERQPTYEKSSVPTLFVHGYRGTSLSFGTMIHRLVRNDYAERSVVLNVSAEGEILEEGKWHSGDNPLIQVVFEDNTNHEWQQAEWIQQILNYLSDTYQTKEVNLVGHSMGGVSIMRYLTTFGSEGSEVAIKQVVTVGSPFNDFNEDRRDEAVITKEGPLVPAPRFVEYENQFNKIPTDIKFLSLAGDVEGDNDSDGTVPVGSVVAMNYLFETYGLDYQYFKLEGQTAQHSALHENRKVDKLIADFLWKISD